MVDVKGLLPGLFISSLIVMFGLWIGSLASSSVIEIEFMPQKTATAPSKTKVAEPTTNISGNTHAIINTSPIVFSNRSYVWSAPKASEVANMKALVSNELGEYSEAYLDAIGLKQVILVDDIQNRAGQPVLGFSDPLAGDIYLNTVELEGEYSRGVVAEQTVHHEIAHFLAYANYGYWFDRDSGWQEIGGNYAYGEIITADKEYFPRDGFVSRYSMSSPSEDFAEVYSLIYTEYFKELLSKESNDSELLSQKTRFVYQTIATIDRDQCRASYRAFGFSACD